MQPRRNVVKKKSGPFSQRLKEDMKAGRLAEDADVVGFDFETPAVLHRLNAKKKNNKL